MAKFISYCTFCACTCNHWEKYSKIITMLQRRPKASLGAVISFISCLLNPLATIQEKHPEEYRNPWVSALTIVGRDENKILRHKGRYYLVTDSYTFPNTTLHASCNKFKVDNAPLGGEIFYPIEASNFWGAGAHQFFFMFHSGMSISAPIQSRFGKVFPIGLISKYLDEYWIWSWRHFVTLTRNHWRPSTIVFLEDCLRMESAHDGYLPMFFYFMLG